MFKILNFISFKVFSSSLWIWCAHHIFILFFFKYTFQAFEMIAGKQAIGSKMKESWIKIAPHHATPRHANAKRNMDTSRRQESISERASHNSIAKSMNERGQERGRKWRIEEEEEEENEKRKRAEKTKGKFTFAGECWNLFGRVAAASTEWKRTLWHNSSWIYHCHKWQ